MPATSPARPILIVGLVMALLLIAAEIATRLWLASSRAVHQVVDIQTPDTLCLKVDRINRAKGPRLVVAGDSLAFSRSLRDHGDRDWEQHELATAIARSWASTGRATPVHMNLGLNGGLPADQVRILQLLSGEPVDLLVLTTSIRSMSADFKADDSAYSRAWLRTVSAHHMPTCRLRRPEDVGADSALGRALASVSTLYAARGLIQSVLFDGSLRSMVEARRSALKRATPASTQANTATALLGADAGALLLAKSRFQQITFDEPHAQVTAMRNLIGLAARKAKVAVFIYGTESPRVLPQLLTSQRYDDHRARLRRLFEGAPSNVVVIDDFVLQSKDYLDYVHINRIGYALMADRIMSNVKF